MSTRILIIDDEEHIRRMMRLTLETAGYEVGEASDGPDGIELFADGSGWDAVILDQRMPGMDGLDTLRELKKRNEDARIVMATAYASIELAVDAMKLGASDFVRKPMTPEVLRNAVAAVLMKARTRPVVKDQVSVTTKHPIQTITMNGFTILDDEETHALEAEHRRFMVVSSEGQQHEVLVEIDTEVVEFVERMTGRRLPPENSFWTSQCRRLLSDYLWNEGKVPPMRRLVLKDLDPDRLVAAARWKSSKAS
jgi:DNA-binding response OmpR family regulator